MKGEFRFKNKMIFGKVFIVLQTVFSTILITMAIVMTAQVNYLVNLPVGYETKDVIQVTSQYVGYMERASGSAPRQVKGFASGG